VRPADDRAAVTGGGQKPEKSRRHLSTTLGSGRAENNLHSGRI
jgi:hypothetical protein